MEERICSILKPHPAPLPAPWLPLEHLTNLEEKRFVSTDVSHKCQRRTSSQSHRKEPAARQMQKTRPNCLQSMCWWRWRHQMPHIVGHSQRHTQSPTKASRPWSWCSSCLPVPPQIFVRHVLAAETQKDQNRQSASAAPAKTSLRGLSRPMTQKAHPLRPSD